MWDCLSLKYQCHHPGHHLLGACTKQFSVNSVSTSINVSTQYQAGCLFQVTNVTLSSVGFVWCRSRFRPHTASQQVNWGRKLLDLSQYYIFLFTMHQSSSSHFCTVSWKSCQTWVWTSQVCLSLLTWSNKHFAVLALMEWKNRRPEKLRPPLRLFTFCGLLRWWSQGLASSGQWPKCFI